MIRKPLTTITINNDPTCNGLLGSVGKKIAGFGRPLSKAGKIAGMKIKPTHAPPPMAKALSKSEKISKMKMARPRLPPSKPSWQRG